MTAGQLLDILERQKFVPPHLVDQLRRKAAAAERPVTLAAIAKSLVDAGHLTAFQARQLIAGDTLVARPAPHLATTVEVPPPEEGDAFRIQLARRFTQARPEVEEELLLAPVDDLPQAPELGAPREPPAAPAQMLKSLGLSKIDDPVEDLLGDVAAFQRLPVPLSPAPQPVVPRWLIPLLATGVAILLVLILLVALTR